MVCYVLLVLFSVFLISMFLLPQLGGFRVRSARNVADPNNCSNYFDGFGFLKTCALDDRFDENRGECANYYMVNCRSRPNPQRVPEELCDAFWSGETQLNVFANIMCNEFVYCIPNTASVTRRVCPLQTFFDVHTRQCLPAEEVDCGGREVS